MSVQLFDYQPDTTGWYSELFAGLQKPLKELPSKLFYDEQGSQLFEQITQLPEYYPTRVEQSIMDRYIDHIATLIGEHCLLIEYGSGSSLKTRTLLEHLPQLAGYVPIDISKKHLLQSATAIARTYPHLEILPVCADYEQNFQIPTPSKPVSRRVIYFPGSTIGNFHPPDAVGFLQHMRLVCGEDSHLLIGVDLKKDEGLLHRAYNDCAGVTAAFNLNILNRLNREVGANFNQEQFAHKAFYNKSAGRIEMHLISLANQTVRLNGHVVDFTIDECIWTESSYKYTPDEFANVAAQAGFQLAHLWTDDNRLFSVQYFKPARSQAHSL